MSTASAASMIRDRKKLIQMARPHLRRLKLRAQAIHLLVDVVFALVGAARPLPVHPKRAHAQYYITQLAMRDAHSHTRRRGTGVAGYYE